MAAVQWTAILGAIAVLVWSVPGLVVNPDFGSAQSRAGSVRLYHIARSHGAAARNR